jgi:hypothetical protein
MGTILVKSALNALKIEVFKNIFFFIEEIQFKPHLFAHPNPISVIISWITSWTISWQIIPYKTERWL